MLIKHHCGYIGVVMNSIWASPVCFFWWLPVLLLVYNLWFHLLLGLAPLTLDVDQKAHCAYIGVVMDSIWASPCCFFWWLHVLLLV